MAKKKPLKKQPKSVKAKALSSKVKSAENVLNQAYQVNQDALFRSTPEGVVFAILTDDMGSFFQIDGIAAQLWELFDGKTPVNKLIQKVKVAKTVSKALLARSAVKLIADLEGNNLIKKV